MDTLLFCLIALIVGALIALIRLRNKMTEPIDISEELENKKMREERELLFDAVHECHMRSLNMIPHICTTVEEYESEMKIICKILAQTKMKLNGYDVGNSIKDFIDSEDKHYCLMCKKEVDITGKIEDSCKCERSKQKG